MGKKIKPKLDKETKEALEKAREARRKKPAFRRQESYRYKRLPTSWRRPKGIHSKMRRQRGYRPPTVKIGYRSAKKTRGLHPSGFEEVMVYNVQGLEGIDPKKQAVRIGHSVGVRKRLTTIERAEKKKIRILNRGGE